MFQCEKVSENFVASLSFHYRQDWNIRKLLLGVKFYVIEEIFRFLYIYVNRNRVRDRELRGRD